LGRKRKRPGAGPLGHRQIKQELAGLANPGGEKIQAKAIKKNKKTFSFKILLYLANKF
jgi:hypothetical protein